MNVDKKAGRIVKAPHLRDPTVFLSFSHAALHAPGGRGTHLQREQVDAGVRACACVFVAQEHDIETPYGMLHVVIRGAPKGNKPAILTYHDVGLNRE